MPPPTDASTGTLRPVRAPLSEICGTAGADGRAIKGTEGGGHTDARVGRWIERPRAHTASRKCGRQGGVCGAPQSLLRRTRAPGRSGW
eukprot:scaffold4774_cov78-Isochrysis_galbana.AAC.2